MCGIVGKVNWSAARTVDAALLERMNEQLTPRGPDEGGLWLQGSAGLAARRLKVIDLVGGQQPMSNAHCPAAGRAGFLRLVLNGQIYNHRVLREDLLAQGHRFASSSDTEVLLHLFEEHGEGTWKLLQGMFAVAVFEERGRRLHLARDRLGIKPLYYALLQGGLIFASEPKAVLVDPEIGREWDAVAVNEYFSLGYVPTPRSVFRSIRKLEPGLALSVHAGSGRIEKKEFWEFRPGAAERWGLEETVTRLDDLLTRTVRDHLASDVPLGLFLSGGLDSSVIAYYAARAAERPLDSYTIFFGNETFSERREAALTAQRLGLRHHEEEMHPSPDILETLGRTLDEPLADPSVLPTYSVCRQARRRVTVALAGDGGDEVFAGYLTYLADRAAELFRRMPRAIQRLAELAVATAPTTFDRTPSDYRLKAFIRAAARPQPDAHFGWLETFPDEEKDLLLTAEFRNSVSGAAPEQSFRDAYARGAGRSALERMLSLDQKTRLLDQYLVRVDRLSMANSLEVRVPLLDHALVEFATRVPSRHKIRGFSTKHLLRHLMRDRLPDVVVRGRKRGFTPPLADWLAGPLRAWAEERLSPSNVRRAAILRPEFPRALLEEHASRRRDNHRKLWAILNFLLWADRHGHATA
jgi:asparagine synthase (glutamine-hydrolysing)